VTVDPRRESAKYIAGLSDREVAALRWEAELRVVQAEAEAAAFRRVAMKLAAECARRAADWAFLEEDLSGPEPS
jgi:hypothetical protein